MHIHESAEDYLERILMLSQKGGSAKSIDIAKALNVSKPSVSFAMKRLRENEYIEMDEEKNITLTKSGYAIAKKILERHNTLYSILLSLGVSEDIAQKDACKIEHDLSEETILALKKLRIMLDKKQI